MFAELVHSTGWAVGPLSAKDPPLAGPSPVSGLDSLTETCAIDRGMDKLIKFIWLFVMWLFATRRLIAAFKAL